MRRRYIKPRFYMIVCLLLALFFGVSFFVSKARLTKETLALEQTLARRTQAAEEVARLEDALDYAHTDEYIETSARNRLGMLFPGEYRYVSN